MHKAVAILVGAMAIAMFSDAAEARRLRIPLSFGKSPASAPVVPVSRPAAANAGVSSSRGGGTFVIMSGNRGSAHQNGPMAAAPRGPIPERGPLHETASAMDVMPSAPGKPSEQAMGQQAEPPAVRTTPVFVSLAAPKSVPMAGKTGAPAQPARMVYCAVRAKGGCAPF